MVVPSALGGLWSLKTKKLEEKLAADVGVSSPSSQMGNLWQKKISYFLVEDLQESKCIPLLALCF